jgi:lipooligosaccharide transport system permease protein
VTFAGTLRPVLRVVEHHLFVYRRTWRGSVFSTVLSPVLYLAAIGLGLGTFVDRASPEGLGGVPYLVFLAPGLLAAQAMNTGAFESTYPVMAGIRWLKTYVAMIISPLAPWHVALGQLAWVGIRITLGAAVFAAVIVIFRAADAGAAVLMVPAAVLTGLAFAAPIQAFAASRSSDTPFAALFRFVIVPMFIFSGTFFPVSQLPDVIEWVAYLTPLWHGVALSRGIALGTLEAGWAVLHVAYLSAWLIGGLVASFVVFRRKLAQ